MAALTKADVIANINHTNSILIENFGVKNWLQTNHPKELKYMTFDALIEIDKEINLYLNKKQDEKVANDFKSTEEGIVISNYAKEKHKLLCEHWQKEIDSANEIINTQIKSILGSEWEIKNEIGYNGCIIAMIDTNSEETKKFVFGAEINISFKNSFYFSKNNEDRELQMNVGTIGAFTFESDRAKFYIGLGKFLNNSPQSKKMRKIISEALINFCIRYYSYLSPMLDKVREVINNPYLYKESYKEELKDIQNEL